MSETKADCVDMAFTARTPWFANHKPYSRVYQFQDYMPDGHGDTEYTRQHTLIYYTSPKVRLCDRLCLLYGIVPYFIYFTLFEPG